MLSLPCSRPAQSRAPAGGTAADRPAPRAQPAPPLAAPLPGAAARGTTGSRARAPLAACLAHHWGGAHQTADQCRSCRGEGAGSGGVVSRGGARENQARPQADPGGPPAAQDACVPAEGMAAGRAGQGCQVQLVAKRAQQVVCGRGCKRRGGGAHSAACSARDGIEQWRPRSSAGSFWHCAQRVACLAAWGVAWPGGRRRRRRSGSAGPSRQQGWSGSGQGMWGPCLSGNGGGGGGRLGASQPPSWCGTALGALRSTLAARTLLAIRSPELSTNPPKLRAAGSTCACCHSLGAAEAGGSSGGRSHAWA